MNLIKTTLLSILIIGSANGATNSTANALSKSLQNLPSQALNHTQQPLVAVQPIIIPQPQRRISFLGATLGTAFLGIIAITAIEYAIKQSSQDLALQLQTAQIKIKELPKIKTEEDSHDTAINLVRRKEYNEIIKIAEKGLQSPNKNEQAIALSLFETLITKMEQRVYPSAIDAGEQALKNSDENIRESGLLLFKKLLKQKNNPPYLAITEVALKCITANSPQSKATGLKLLTSIITTGHPIVPSKIEIIRQHCKDNQDQQVQSAFLALGQKLPNLITSDDIQKFTSDLNNTQNIQDFLWAVHDNKTSENTKTFQQAAAQKGLESKDPEAKRISLLIYEKLLRENPKDQKLIAEITTAAKAAKEFATKENSTEKAKCNVPNCRLEGQASKLLKLVTPQI